MSSRKMLGILGIAAAMSIIGQAPTMPFDNETPKRKHRKVSSTYKTEMRNRQKKRRAKEKRAKISRKINYKTN